MNKGFTLTELLAVIVILTLITVIVIPKIQDTIKATDLSLKQRSLDLYGRAATMAVNVYELTEGKLPVSFEDIIPYIEYDGAEVDCKMKKINKNKSVYLSACTVGDESLGNYTYGYKTLCVAVTEELKTTGNIPTGNYMPGDEYLCEVKPGVEYTFFVLGVDSNDATKVNLIMDSNIDKQGNPIKENGTGERTVQWSSTSNKTGPVQALRFLANATLDWINLPNIEIDYIDEGNRGGYGYQTIKTIDDVTTITNRNGTKSAEIENLKVRLPNYTDFKSDYFNCDSAGQCPLWAVNYMAGNTNYPERIVVSDINSYWLSASYASNDIYGAMMYYTGNKSFWDVDSAVKNGVRPVITISKMDLS